MNRALRLACLLFIAAACGRCVAPARAATYTWNTNAGGAFTDASKWTDISLPLVHAVPGASDTALFDRNLNIQYGVTFPGSALLTTRNVAQLGIGKNAVSFADTITGLQSP